MSFVQSRTTINEKLDIYSKWFDDVLITAMKNTDFINLELDIWSGGNGRSYLGVSASFAPNLTNEKVLNGVGAQALLNNDQQPFNSHLLDFIDISDVRHTGEHLFNSITEVLTRFEITGKVGSITSDNATNNISMHSYILYNLMRSDKPETFQKTEHFHHIRCASHILNILFQGIVKHLRKDKRFKRGLKQISELARTIKKSSLLRSSLADAGLPLIPSAPETRWVFIWKQVETYLKYYDSYSNWATNLQASSEHKYVISKIMSHIDLSSETKYLLEYFVGCCSIFNYLNDKLQNDSFNQLPNAVSFYFTLKDFYELCHHGQTENITLPSEGSFDYTFINGKPELPAELKFIVLEAVLATRLKFEEYFDLFRNNDIYFVAAFLDPTSKFDCFNELATEEEGEYHYHQVEFYIKGYLARCQSKKKPVPPCTELRSGNAKSNKVCKIPRRDKRQTLAVHPSLTKGIKVQEEWERYKADSQLNAETATDTIKWWYSRRLVYPNLFPLAISMIYTRFSSCGMERTFSISGKLMRKDRRSLGSANTRRIMLLRNRFSNFGLFDKELEIGPSPEVDESFVIVSDSDPSSSDELSQS